MTSPFQEKITKVYNALTNKINSSISTHNSSSSSHQDLRNSKISYGQVDSTSTSTVFTATVPNLNELVDGTTVMLRNGYVTSAEGFTLEINGLGAKPVYSNLANTTRDTTIFNINYTMLFVYDSTRVDGGCWICYRGYDSNTNTVGYQIRTNSTPFTATDKGYKYRLWLETDGNKYMPVNTSTSTNATANRSSAMNTREFWIGGKILYNATNGTTNANATMSTTTLWQQYTITLGYSFNNTGSALTLTLNEPLYMVAKAKGNGKAQLNTPYYTQTLPSTEDGLIYIYLGHMYSATALELALDHPVYEYKNGAIRLYRDYYTTGEVDTLLSGKSNTGHTHTVSNITDFPTIPSKTSDLTNDSHFISTSSTTGLMKNDGSIDTNHYLTSHQDISGKANISDLGATAFSNDYTDLDNQPSIPTSTSDLMNNGDGDNGNFVGEDQLGSVAFSNSYDDLDNQPTDVSDFTDTFDTPFTPKSHTHGNLQNDGKVGTSNNASKNVVTDSNGKITTEAKPTIPSASTTVPSADTSSGSYGSGTTYARSNHIHPKSSLYAEATHNHTKSQITDFPSIPSKTSDLTNDSNFISTSSTNGLIKNDGSIDTSSYITSSAITSHNSNASAHSSLFNGKANSVHTHSTSDITDFPAIPSDLEDLTDNTGILHFYDYIAYDDMSGVPLSDFNNDLDVSDFTDNYDTEFTPKSHTHSTSDITDLYKYEISSSEYNPTIDSTITIYVKVTDENNTGVANHTFTMKTKNGDVSLTTDSNGQATHSYTCNTWGNQRFRVNGYSMFLNVTGWKTITRTNYTLWINGAERLCEIRYYKSKASIGTSWTFVETISDTDYVPAPQQDSVYCACNMRGMVVRIFSSGAIQAQATTATSNQLFSFHTMWHY